LGDEAEVSGVDGGAEDGRVVGHEKKG
jgi:hypothetical protein